MKKFKSLKLMLLGVLAMGSMNAFAQDLLTNGLLQFKLDGGKAIITGFAKDQKAEEVVIGEKIKNIADGKEYEVKEIQNNAFKNAGVKSLDMSKCKIGTLTPGMFAGMGSLKELKLGGNVKDIEAGAFAETGLIDLNLKNTKVTTVRNYFKTNMAYRTNDKPILTFDDEYDENIILAGGAAVKAGDNDLTQPKNYTDKEAAEFNGKLPGAIKAGDDLKYTEATANAYNKATYGSTYSWIKVAGDSKVYTAKTAAEYNENLPANLKANVPLTEQHALLYNTYVNGFTYAQIKAGYYDYLRHLDGARLYDGNPVETFANSGEAYDYNKEIYGNKTTTDGKKFILSAVYSPAEADEYNAKKKSTDPAVAVGDKKKEAYYTANDPEVKAGEAVVGQLKPGYEATLVAANNENRILFGPGIAIVGDKKNFAMANDEVAFNETLFENEYAGIDFSDKDNAVTKKFIKNILYKKAGDTLSEADALAYNSTLDGHVSKGDVVLDEEGNPVEMDDHDAYVYNQEMALENGIGTFATAGNLTGTVANATTAAEYNASLPGAVKAGEKNGQYVKYTKATANTKNRATITAAGKTPWTAGTGMVKKGKEQAASNPFKSLTSVELPSSWETIASESKPEYDRDLGAFENCPNLATVDFGGNPNNKNITGKSTDKTISFGENAFVGTALSAIDLSKTKVDALPSRIIVDGKYVTANSTLESLTLNPFIAAIPGGLFADCKKLKTVTFPTDDQQLTKEQKDNKEKSEYSKAVVVDEDGATFWQPSFSWIGDKAFANTAIESFRLPATATNAEGEEFDIVPTEDLSWSVDANAFAGCTKLKEFIFVPRSITPDEEVDQAAFPGCKGIAFKTTHAYQTTNPKAPKNSHYEMFVAGYTTEFKTAEFKDKAGKYYIKYKATKNIRVKKDEATVYNAYLDEADFTLNMCKYKATGSYYEIAMGATVLILTNKEDLQFEDGEGYNGSWLDYENDDDAHADFTNPYPIEATYNDVIENGDFGLVDPTCTVNALEIVTDEDGATLTELDTKAGAPRVVYGWVSSATKGTGFMKITSANGGKFQPGTMYILAAEPSEDARLNVRWLDENGNVDAETTGIKKIDAEAADSDAIYNLQGIQVKGAQKGVFIQNGKKYVK